MILVAPEIEQYTHAHTSPRSPLFDELREVTYGSMASPHMQVGRVEGTLLKTLCAVMGARRVLEVGTFTGFSALCMAEALPDDGELVTCDRALPSDPPFDLAFIDADKERYLDYYELILPRLRRGGLLIADNTLWSGHVLAPRAEEKTDGAIVAYNRRVAEDPRVENVLLSVRDGIMIARKL